MRKIKLNKDTEITLDVIKYVLEQHKNEADRINKLQKYYDNDNDIKNRSYNNGNKPKNKLANPYASYITDTAVGYFLGKPITYNNIEKYEAIDMAFKYNDESDTNTTLATNSSVCGYSIEMLYTDEEANVRFTSINPSECAVVY
ncbi:phage portal protein, partial [Clostridium sp.]|uniref:phage portal protein n=1 Tax=Clostridium sp. TaxID=1506 RepID=UPI003F40E949